MSIENNIHATQKQMRDAATTSNRNLEEVHLIAVTKSVSPEIAQEVVQQGIFHLAENRPEKLIEKQESLTDERIKWHYIGSLQTRKVKQVIQRIDYFHALDRLSLAQEIDKRADKVIPCFVQVNVSGEEQKHGIAPADLIAFIHELEAFPKIQVIGLMTMAPNTTDETVIRTTFAGLKKLQQQVETLHLPSAPCHELSMGMSHDFVIAIEEGATFVRVGTKLFATNS
ncbi:YggS family pyridoxal phosphate-dependent enzyme [Isobaculum melis]|uniref:Pyridoxal phosphate homeostasis protein n=1 Tax=Isobaculum melis TaxID=142588 RepID=A0A1H9T6Y4_9LACT|nr:YggS family pyridoxal phosphate-dependent enzyme [Isobaculum melis]SER92847.1 hypothetical protein SAMN04488559_11113 [Isobaculum melis]